MRMKEANLKILVLVAFILAFAPFLSAQETQVDMYIFHGQGCPHCANLLEKVEEWKTEFPFLNIKDFEIYFNDENRALLEQLSAAYGTEIQGVPTAFIGDKVIVGFSDSIERSLEQEVEHCLEEGCASPEEKLENKDTVSIVGDSSPSEDPGKAEAVKKLTIPAVLSAAVVDAINPCAFAVLIILLTTILSAGRKKRVLYAGLAFSTSIFISYFLMGLGLYSAVQAAGLTHKFYTIVAILAILVGLFNLKDYLWYGKWFIMEVPLSWRPRMKSVLRGVTSVPGAFLIGFVISLFLLPCTSGPYIVILGLLAKVTTRNQAIMLLLFYNLVFVLPMLIITLAIFFGFTTTEKAEAWRKSKLKILHLIAGSLILLIGIGMFIAMGLGLV